MRLGILADSHGHADTTATAVRLLLDAGAQKLIHLGDLCGESVIDELVGHDAHVVFGNCDFNVDALTRYARHVGVHVDHPAGRLEIDGRVVVYTHGHLDTLLREAIADGVDYLLHGHSHELRDERIGTTRVLNPGALFRASRYTAALLDTADDSLVVVDVPRAT